jgi:hypothetical protein
MSVMVTGPNAPGGRRAGRHRLIGVATFGSGRRARAQSGPPVLAGGPRTGGRARTIVLSRGRNSTRSRRPCPPRVCLAKLSFAEIRDVLRELARRGLAGISASSVSPVGATARPRPLSSAEHPDEAPSLAGREGLRAGRIMAAADRVERRASAAHPRCGRATGSRRRLLEVGWGETPPSPAPGGRPSRDRSSAGRRGRGLVTGVARQGGDVAARPGRSSIDRPHGASAARDAGRARRSSRRRADALGSSRRSIIGTRSRAIRSMTRSGRPEPTPR